MLIQYLPWALLALAILAVFARPERPDQPVNPARKKAAHMAGGVAVILGILLAALGYGLASKLPTADAAGAGLFLGLFASALCGFLGSRYDWRDSNPAAPLAFGAAAIAFARYAPASDVQIGAIGAAAGLAIGARIVASAPSRWPSLAAMAGGLALLANILGSYAAGDRGAVAGVAIVACFALVGALSRIATSGLERQSQLVRIGVTLVAGLAAMYLVATRVVFMGDVFTIAVASVVAAVITMLLVQGDDSGSAGPVLAAILWIGVATYAFFMRKGFGMSVSLATAGTVLALAGNWRAILSLGPLAALVVYRCFREMYSTDARGLDIAQHNALIALLAGFGLLALMSEWARGRKEDDPRTVIASVLWAVILLVFPVLVGVVLGGKGYVAAFAGLGIGTFIALIRAEDRPLAFCAQLGASAFMLIEFRWIIEKLDLTRDLKFQTLIWFGVALTLAAALIAFLSRPRIGGETAKNT